MTDQELVVKACDGDVEAFESLVGRHHRSALRAALAALGSAQDADDVTQEAWLAVHARLSDFRGQSSFRTWLLTIVWNKALDKRREVGRVLKRLVRLDADWDEGSERGAAMLESAARPSTVSPEARVITGDLTRQVQRLVRALPAKLRDPLLLAGSGDYTYDEIASMLGVPSGTVKWRVFEARRQLKVRLRRLGYA